jgi:hypothetical protein
MSTAKRALLRALLRGVEPASLTKRELCLMVDLLEAALRLRDASPDLGEEFIGR